MDVHVRVEQKHDKKSDDSYSYQPKTFKECNTLKIFELLVNKCTSENLPHST